ncbi:hypothetical protein [Sporomusa termitida]|uniref:Uncharacterized protein n=1 Tax=Sporomusa termitida TaxID=2377 RepID=A0A517DNR5_9FIRM|nr:hypothetical protein [Sporomusa termitida]QDR78948.1 hypothetical protein SPTER_01990 [Sporomusa termitida]
MAGQSRIIKESKAGVMDLVQVAASQQAPPRYIAPPLGLSPVFLGWGTNARPGVAGIINKHYCGFAGAYLFGASCMVSVRLCVFSLSEGLRPSLRGS